MKKKSFKIKFRSVLTAVMCLLAAMFFWIYMNFDSDLSSAISLLDNLI